VTAAAHRALLSTAALAFGVAAWALTRRAPNFDAEWALHWGRELSGGAAPAFAAPGAPTPHPLANLLGAGLSPLGAAGAPIWIVLCLSALGCAGYLTFRLGELWFGPVAGALAAAILITRPEVVSFAARGYLDLPYLALVLYALLAFARDRESGLGVSVPLAAAGLLRPEAWLFAAIHAAWRARAGLPWQRSAALAVAPALIWLGMDMAATADPLHSLHVTRANTVALGRATGLGGAVSSIPGRMAAVLAPGPAVALVLAACAGARHARAAVGALALAAAAAALVALAGMPVIMRYVLLPATLLTILGAGGATAAAARALERRRRRTAHPPPKLTPAR
jgi:hypothetical protein